MKIVVVALTGLALAMMVGQTSAHGRLVVPASRASMWRYGYGTKADYNDNQAFCGGYYRQHEQNEGRCGICGDAFDAQTRPHEAPGGEFASTGIIVADYQAGDWIDVEVEITAQHKGYFEFKICPTNDWDQDQDQACFDEIGRLETSYHNDDHTYPMLEPLHVGMFQLQVKLPESLTCEQCVFQWTYVTGNSWGTCANGTGAVGCGPQETFRGCADVAISQVP